MNKYFLCILVGLILVGAANAQRVSFVESAQNFHTIKTEENAKISITSSIAVLDKFDLVDYDTLKGYLQISIPSYTFSNNLGHPKLPIKVDIIEIPEGASCKISILSAQYKEFDLKDLGYTQKILPVQLPWSKSQKAPPSFQYIAQIYESDSLYSPDLVTLEMLGKMRSTSLAKLITSPVHYYPNRNRLRVYYDLNFEIIFENAIQNTYNKKRYQSSEFQNVLKKHLPSFQKEHIQSPLGYMIVADSIYRDTLQPFIRWKKELGYEVFEAYTSSLLVGKTSSSIHNYLQSIYDAATPENPAPTYLLLVGDDTQIPGIMSRLPFKPLVYPSNHPSDMYYGEFTGDMLPDMFVGRLSANTVNELGAQLDKIMFMEKGAMGAAFLDTSLFVAGYDVNYGNTHLNKQMNYAQSTYFNEENDVYSIKYLYPDSRSQSANIINDFNNGVGFYSYSGHGTETELSNPYLNTANVLNFSNQNKYPVVFANCCLTANFKISLCLGEAFLRAPKKGAVGYIGGSNYTYFDEDLFWTVGFTDLNSNVATYESSGLGIYDKLWHTHGEAVSTWVSSLGRILVDGNLIVTASNSILSDYYWEVYHVLGDPSYLLPLKRFRPLQMDLPDTIYKSQSCVSVQTEPNVYISISDSIKILGAAYSDSMGRAEVCMSSLPQGEQIFVSGILSSRLPFYASIPLKAFPFSFINITAFSFRDKNNLLVDNFEYGSSYQMDVELSNVGERASDSSILLLKSSQPFCKITQERIAIGALQANQSKKFSKVFTFDIASSVPNKEEFTFLLTSIFEDSMKDEKSIQKKVFAPDFNLRHVEFEDMPYNYLDVGANANTLVSFQNKGEVNAKGVSLNVESLTENIVIEPTQIYIDSIAINNTGIFSFTSKVSENAIKGAPFILKFILQTQGRYDTFFYYSQIGPNVENFETNDFSKYAWEFNEHPWIICDSNPFHGGVSARSGHIQSSEKSVMKLKWNSMVDDSIRFSFRTQTEKYTQDWGDFLRFFIDGVEQKKWGGHIGWTTVSFPVKKGVQEFQWVYSKTLTQSEGKVWVDEIVLPPLTKLSNSDKDLEQSPFFIVYASESHIRLKTLQYVDGGELLFINSMGKLLFSQAVAGNEFEIPIDHLPSGIYLCILKYHGKFEARKFWKKGEL